MTDTSSKCFIHINSFDPYDNLMRGGTGFPYFPDEKTEPKKLMQFYQHNQENTFRKWPILNEFNHPALLLLKIVSFENKSFIVVYSS